MRYFNLKHPVLPKDADSHPLFKLWNDWIEHMHGFHTWPVMHAAFEGGFSMPPTKEPEPYQIWIGKQIARISCYHRWDYPASCKDEPASSDKEDLMNSTMESDEESSEKMASEEEDSTMLTEEECSSMVSDEEGTSMASDDE